MQVRYPQTSRQFHRVALAKAALSQLAVGGRDGGRVGGLDGVERVVIEAERLLAGEQQSVTVRLEGRVVGTASTRQTARLGDRPCVTVSLCDTSGSDSATQDNPVPASPQGVHNR